MKRVLLTGAGGFVGHHTLEHILATTDWEVVCLDSFRHRGKTDRIREVISAHDGHDERQVPDCGEWCHRVEVLQHDLTVPIATQLDHQIGHIDYVISMASESHVDRSCVEPRPFIENNVALVLTLLEWVRARQHPYTAVPGAVLQAAHPPVRKFIHVSTDEVYGPAWPGHNHAEGEPHRPSNPYSASKACQEDIVFSYWRTFGLPVGISNTMNIIGERQDPEKFVPMVMAKIAKGETVTIHAAPAPHQVAPVVRREIGSRFYLHARNQADALLFLLNNVPFPRYGDHSDVAAGGASMARYNVVGEREIDNLAMAKLIADAAGRDLNYELVDFHSSRPGHDLRYALDGGRMRDLGWKAPVPLEASLRKTVEWTLENRRWLLP